ncbi:MAG: 2-phospho-L-lactate guanylyltransferase [Candidatus Promineifilaceae bacterium]
MMRVWAIIPVKPLRDSKSRLSGILGADQRAGLTASILERTLAILNETAAVERALVVSRDPAVLKIGRLGGALTFGEGDRQGLNAALMRASAIATARRAQGLLILPADLPFLTLADVQMMLNAAGDSVGPLRAQTNLAPAMAICPDYETDGTNALLICPPAGFDYQFGPSSFRAHLEEAARLGLARRIVHAPGIKFDLDTADDWALYQALTPDAGLASSPTAGAREMRVV